MDRYVYNDNDDDDSYDEHDNDEDDAPYAKVFLWRHHLLMPKKVPPHYLEKWTAGFEVF